jgi:hypothetical protein
MIFFPYSGISNTTVFVYSTDDYVTCTEVTKIHSLFLFMDLFIKGTVLAPQQHTRENLQWTNHSA